MLDANNIINTKNKKNEQKFLKPEPVNKKSRI